MGEVIKKQFRVNRDVFGWIIGIELFAGTFGILLFGMITAFAGDEKNYIPIGVIMALLLGILFIAIYAGIGIKTCFNMEISFGVNRMQFFVSYYLVYLTVTVGAAVVPALFQLLEGFIHARFYPDLISKMDAMKDIWEWWLPVSFAVPAIACMCGVLIMKFGQKAGWIIYAVWIVACLGVPKLTDAREEAPASMFGRMGSSMYEFAVSISKQTWMLLLAAAGAVGLLVTYLLIRKQEVSA